MGALKCRERTHGYSEGLGMQGHRNGKLRPAAALEQRETLGMHQRLRCSSSNSHGWASGLMQRHSSEWRASLWAGCACAARTWAASGSTARGGVREHGAGEGLEVRAPHSAPLSKQLCEANMEQYV